MTFLRSPAVHHITPDALGIVEYAERHNRTSEFAPPYSQPSTQLFWDFCGDLLTELAQYRVYHQFEVTKLRWDKGAGKFPFRLISKDGDGFRSRCVILGNWYGRLHLCAARVCPVAAPVSRQNIARLRI